VRAASVLLGASRRRGRAGVLVTRAVQGAAGASVAWGWVVCLLGGGSGCLRYSAVQGRQEGKGEG